MWFKTQIEKVAIRSTKALFDRGIINLMYDQADKDKHLYYFLVEGNSVLNMTFVGPVSVTPTVGAVCVATEFGHRFFVTRKGTCTLEGGLGEYVVLAWKTQPAVSDEGKKKSNTRAPAVHNIELVPEVTEEYMASARCPPEFKNVKINYTSLTLPKEVNFDPAEKTPARLVRPKGLPIMIDTSDTATSLGVGPTPRAASKSSGQKIVPTIAAKHFYT